MPAPFSTDVKKRMEKRHLSADPLKAGLYLVSTPIGRARDITLHALDVLATADILVAEDTRVLRKLLDIHGLALGARSVRAYHDHSQAKDRDWILNQVAEGKSVALTSDAGTPLIADPGFGLVKEAYTLGLHVDAAPGVSALTMAVSLAGLPSDRIFFCGFLPPKTQARKKAIEEVKDLKTSLVFYESPKRVLKTLADMADVFGATREIALARELTKKFQEIERGSIEELILFLENKPSIKGEIVLVVGHPVGADVKLGDIGKELGKLVQEVGVKQASVILSEKYGLPKKDLYAQALDLKNETSRSR